MPLEIWLDLHWGVKKSLIFKVNSIHCLHCIVVIIMVSCPGTLANCLCQLRILDMFPRLSNNSWVWFPPPVSVMVTVKFKELALLSEQALSFRPPKTMIRDSTHTRDICLSDQTCMDTNSMKWKDLTWVVWRYLQLCLFATIKQWLEEPLYKCGVGGKVVISTFLKLQNHVEFSD